MNKKVTTIMIIILFFVFVIIIFSIINKPKQVKTRLGVIRLDISSRTTNQIQGSDNLFQNIEVGSAGFQGANSDIQAISSQTLFNRQDLNIE